MSGLRNLKIQGTKNPTSRPKEEKEFKDDIANPNAKAKLSTQNDKEVKRINVKPLMPMKRLNSDGDVKMDKDINEKSPKDKLQPVGSIHEILEKMKVSPHCADAKAGKIAAERWRRKTAKDIYDEFCTDTSFTALTRIHKSKHLYKRILWIVACLSMLAWMTLQCVWLFQKYCSYPVEVKIEVTAVPNLAFPSVTICNLNPLKRSMMKEGPFKDVSNYFQLNDNDMLYDNYIEETKQSFMADNTTSFGDYTNDSFWQSFMMEKSFNKWDTLENDSTLSEKFYQQMDDSHLASFMYSTVAVQLSDDDIQRYGHRKQDLIVSCTWQGFSCSPANFTYHRSNMFGNCYTFNTFNNGMSGLSTNYAGPLMGLVLEVNIEQDEYISALSPDAGLRMVIHERGTYPVPEDEGINIPPGFKTSIGLAMTDLTRLPPPHGDCGSSGYGVTNIYKRDFGTSYSKQTCLKSCLQDELLTSCECMTSMFYVPKDSPVCPLTNCNASNCMEKTFLLKLGSCNDRCPSPCDDIKYDLTTSMSKWPSEQYEHHLDSKIMKSMSTFMTETGRQNSEDTLAKVEVYYRELIVENIEQQRAYESENLISDIGGQLGLWLGLSAITFGELIEFLASLSRLIIGKCCRRKETEPALLDPVSA